jgi:hypothetical protein
MGLSPGNMLGHSSSVRIALTYSSYSMLLKILPFALSTRRLSVQALQSRSCLAYVSYSTTGRTGEINYVILKGPVRTSQEILRLHNNDQPVNAHKGNDRCLF